MGIKLIRRKMEGSPSKDEFQSILDMLSSLYSGNVKFQYDAAQNAIMVSESGRVLGLVRAEGALHTVVWAALSLAEKVA